MSDYYVIQVPAPAGAGVIDSYPPGGPADWRYHEAVSLRDAYPKGATMKFSRNFPDGRVLLDFVPNILMALIVSPKARKVIDTLEVRNAEFLPVTILDHRGGVAGEDYAILNLIGTEDAIDRSASTLRMSALIPAEIDRVKKMVLEKKAISPDAKMFRCRNAARVMLARDDVRAAFEKAALTGPVLIPPADWNGLHL